VNTHTGKKQSTESKQNKHSGKQNQLIRKKFHFKENNNILHLFSFAAESTQRRKVEPAFTTKRD
ncbi:MAG: hypothetical protein IKA41_05045, partial [Bacteroidaceae bacterium]|nr:hypothetical protein [Bacteroidaceae bacterium]